MSNPVVINFNGKTYEIGPSKPVFIIAEAGVNHNGDINLAHELIDIAVCAKADAVKFQTYDIDILVTKNAPKAEYQIKNTDNDESQYEMLKKLQLSFSDHVELYQHCLESNIVFLSSVFDEKSVDLLSKLEVPALKIPSGEITNHTLLSYAAKLDLPMLVSTGMSDMNEVKQAVHIIQNDGNNNVVLLHCVSNYPSDINESNIRAIDTLRNYFNVPTGFSDHTLGINISLAAVARGANIIEKHITLDNTLPGPDHKASLSAKQFTDLVSGIRDIEESLGDGVKTMQTSEISTAKIARKSLIAAVDIPEGKTLDESMLRISRPGTGLSPSLLNEVLLSKSRHNISKGDVLQSDDLIFKNENINK